MDSKTQQEKLDEGGLHLAVRTLFEKKANNILVLEVKEISTMTDFFVIAEGNVDVHVRALGRSLMRSLREIRQTPVHVEGLTEGDWVVMDYMEFVVHIMTPQIRARYMLEQLWKSAKVVDFDDVFRSPDSKNLI